MKRFLPFLISFLFFVNAKAQYVTIPDAKFVTWLQANVPSAMNGNQMDTTDISVTTMTFVNVQSDSISDITGIQYFDALNSLNCANNQITFLPNLPSSLSILDCYYNQLAALPTLPSNLISLSCSVNNLTSLPFLPNSLTGLDVSGNHITILPSLPSSLDYFDCGGNSISNLPSLPGTITNFKCWGNPISALPTLPTNLQFMEVEQCQLTTLPSLPNSLILLWCWSNQLTALPTLPSNLSNLSCPQNLLSALPSLPLSLQSLECDNNQITTLPALPNSLTTLSCASNQLTSLPALPSSLTTLICYQNQLTSLPPLPATLIDLEPFNNPIGTLPSLPSSLQYLDCYNCSLTSCPALPSGLVTLKMAQNNISCFPPFPNLISTLSIGQNPIACLPNYVAVMDQTTLSYPLCLPGNTNGCPQAQGIFGFTYEDKNADCARNTGDSGLVNIPLVISDLSNNILARGYSFNKGIYNFPQTAGTYKIEVDTLSRPFVPQCTSPGIDTSVAVTLLDTNVNFSIKCKPGFDVGVQSISRIGRAFPGQTHMLKVYAGDMSQWYNLNCASGIAGQVQISVSGNVTYSAPALGALTPSVSSNVFTYTIADFGLIDNKKAFNVMLETDTSAQVGDTICVTVTVTVTPSLGDADNSNNVFTFCYIISNSHDPNLKEVYPMEVLPAYNGWFTYTIHFQNTGTAPAINIRVSDILDANLDLNTFQLLDYSHPVSVFLNSNQLTFNFSNILLPDSLSNPQGSMGFVQYRIKPNPNLPSGTQVFNQAFIYFDYNYPIYTNTTINLFTNNIGIKENTSLQKQLSIYPNPSSGQITIHSSKEFKNQKLFVYSVEGSLLLEKTITSENETIDISNFARGIYFVRLGTYNTKLVKN